jgi:hypothetical protein
MRHQEIIELLPWYVNNTLEESERRQIAGHLDKCAVCSEEVKVLRLMESHLIDLDREISAASPDPLAASREEVGRLQQSTSFSAKIVRLFVPPGGFSLNRGGLMPIAACLLLAIVGYQNLWRPTSAGEGAAEVAGVVSIARLPSQERGTERTIAIDPADAFVLFEFDVNAEDETLSRYGFYLKSADRETFLTAAAAAAEFTLRVPRSLLNPEQDYELIVRADPRGHAAEPLETFPFHTRAAQR